MPLRSLVWNYFTRLNSETSFCKTCDRELSTKGSNTSNLATHLRHNHFSDYQQIKGECSSENAPYSNANECSKFSNEDSTGNDELFEKGTDSKDPLVAIPPDSSKSGMTEVASLLSLAMPMANINFLVDEGGGKDEAVAIEVRPKERLFRVSLQSQCRDWEESKVLFRLFINILKYPSTFVL